MPLAGHGLTVDGEKLGLLSGVCPVGVDRFLMLLTDTPPDNNQTMTQLVAYEADTDYPGYTRQLVEWDTAASAVDVPVVAEIRNTNSVVFTQNSIAVPVPVLFVALCTSASGTGGQWLAYWEIPGGGFTPAAGAATPFTVRFQADSLALRIT